MVDVRADPWEYSDKGLLVIFDSYLERSKTDVGRRRDGAAAIFVGQPTRGASSRILNPAATLVEEVLWLESYPRKTKTTSKDHVHGLRNPYCSDPADRTFPCDHVPLEW